MPDTASLIRRLTQARDRVAGDFDAAPDLRELARIAGLSPHHMLRAFRRQFGETPHDLLTRRRLEAAKAALRAGRSVTEAVPFCFAQAFAPRAGAIAISEKPLPFRP